MNIQEQFVGGWFPIKDKIGSAPEVIWRKGSPFNGIACPCIQNEEQYIWADSQKVYLRGHMTQTSLIDNLLLLTSPPETRFRNPLHGILPLMQTRVCLTLHYYTYVLRCQFTANMVTVPTHLAKIH